MATYSPNIHDDTANQLVEGAALCFSQGSNSSPESLSPTNSTLTLPSCGAQPSSIRHSHPHTSRLLHKDRRVRFSSDGEMLSSTNNRESFVVPTDDSPDSTPYDSPSIRSLSLLADHGTSYFDPQAASEIADGIRKDSNDKSSSATKQVLETKGEIEDKALENQFPEGLNLSEDKNMSNSIRTQMMARIESYSAPTSPTNSPTLTPTKPILQLDGEPLDIQYLDAKSIEEAISSKSLSIASEAHKLVRAHTSKGIYRSSSKGQTIKYLHSGKATPLESVTNNAEEQIRSGILSSLLQLYNNHCTAHWSSTSLARSGTSTPETECSSCLEKNAPKWYEMRSPNASVSSLGGLVTSSSSTLMSPLGFETRDTMPQCPKGKYRKFRSSNLLKSSRFEDEIKITIHIAELLAREKYILKLCRALMTFGAPTHRLEEYMKSTSRVLGVDGQFLYIPGCMIISFDDPSTHTSDMHIVRVAQGCDLGKLDDTHFVYKQVVHDIVGVNEATKQLDEILTKPQRYNRWALVAVYGLASATVGPFAFEAQLIDMPICFLLGCILGFLQLILAPLSDLYSNVSEISAAVLLSFLARAFGSIHSGEAFCFSALTQSSIALILPGYTILCGSLELQSKNIVAGSVRMFYAIIYSLFLGFGITIGAVMYGVLDKNATSKTTCSNPLPTFANFGFVPLFALCLLICNHAKWKHAPIMIFIAISGYVVNLFSSMRFVSTPQVANALGAFVIGVMGNLYSRFYHGLAFAAMLPGVLVQVPSGLASQGSIISGISSADAMISNSTITPQEINSTVLQLGFGMIQISIGITVGLFASALVIYPFGKKRSSLFSF